MMATVTSKGQVTLPAEARAKLGIGPGTKLEFIVIDGGRLEVIPLTSSVRALKGIVPKPVKPVTLDEMDDAIAQGAQG